MKLATRNTTGSRPIIRTGSCRSAHPPGGTSYASPHLPPVAAPSSSQGSDCLPGHVSPRRLRAFTLIELILVLTLLAIATSLAIPSLSRFFRGRALDSEARQLLSLTRAGQSRAVSEGFPVLLWIDSQERQYGIQLDENLESESRSSNEIDEKAEQFPFDENVSISAPDGELMTVNGRSLPAIRFLPDGMADETSLTKLRLESRAGEVLWLLQATNRMRYEIRNSDR